MAESLPYVVVVGTLKKVLEKIKDAATPERFTQDYLADTLGVKGGAARATIPFLKKAGFLNGDGTPTDLYRQYRNPSASGAAVATAIKKAYAPLFAANENAHKIQDAELKNLIVQATQLDHDSRVVQGIFGTFKLLKPLADFDKHVESPLALSKVNTPPVEHTPPPPPTPERHSELPPVGMNLSYTINLNLPATPDVNVFNAIFRSLKENLLKR